jgi:hypothetical protein
MALIKDEILLDHTITTREGVTITFSGVPTRIRRGPNDEEILTHAFSVALRLEQLTRAVASEDPTPGRTVMLEF